MGMAIPTGKNKGINVKHLSHYIAATVLAASTLLVSGGCSNQWREGDAQLTGAEMLAMLEEVGAGTSGTNDSKVADALKDQDISVIYAADADRSNPGPLGPVASVLAIDDLGFLGDSWLHMGYQDVAKVRIFFLDALTTTDRSNGLVIGLARSGSDAFSYYGFSGTSQIVDGEFIATLTGANGDVVLRSWDVDGEDLTGVIQMRVFDVDRSTGVETEVGKFSTLVGYGS